MKTKNLINKKMFMISDCVHEKCMTTTKHLFYYVYIHIFHQTQFLIILDLFVMTPLIG